MTEQTEFALGVSPPLTGQTRLFAILGDPIAQAGSPGLFNREFSRQAMQAVLVPMHVTPDALASVISTFRNIQNFDGLVITVPHKFVAATLVDELGPQARATGAVNVIRKNADGRILGENFDGEGFIHGLVSQGHTVAGRRVLLIGAGGAGYAVAHAIALSGATALGIVEIDTARRDALVRSIASLDVPTEVFATERSAHGFDVVVNCTPVGMHLGDPLPVDIEGANDGALFADIILKPTVTPLLYAAASRGYKTHAGHHMLEGQVDAVLDFLFNRSSHL